MAITPHLRSQSCHGLPGAASVRAALEGSKHSYGLIIGGVPVLLWGMYSESLFSESAYIWGLVSEYAERHRIAVGRASKIAVRKALQLYDVLYTTTDPDYELAHKWVLWLGFKEVDPQPTFRVYRLTKGES